MSYGILQQGGGRTYDIGQFQHSPFTFGMGQNDGLGILLLDFNHLFN